MDLYAYSQIDELKELLEQNKIEIQRLRGLRLMKDEEAISDKDLDEMIADNKLIYAIDWLKQKSDRFWESNKDDNKHKSFIYKKGEIVGIDMSKVHGRNKKHIKLKWKQIDKEFRLQYEMFNKYVGKNVLYVHARQGGGNRPYYPIDTKHPMYLCDVDDAVDGTYCDIYYDLNKGKVNNE